MNFITPQNVGSFGVSSQLSVSQEELIYMELVIWVTNLIGSHIYQP
jgi:hypothetical protein